MQQKYLLFFCLSLAVLEVRTQLAIEVKDLRISNLLSRITNTTFGIIQGGVDLISRSVDRVVNTFARIEDRLRALLEIFRKQLLQGIPQLNIPILDPLHVKKINFDVNHEALRLTGNVEDVIVKHISKFVVDKEKFTDLGNLRFKLDLNLTFPYIKVNGTYKINGSLGDAFMVYGNGPFWINLINLKLKITTVLKFNLPARVRVESIDMDVKLQELRNYFDNLMKDKENGILINKLISKLAPEALDMLWPEIKPSVQEQIKQYINNILENVTVVNLAKRLFNIV